MGGGNVPQMTLAERLAIMKEEEAQAVRAREAERKAKMEDDMVQAAILAGQKAKAAAEATAFKKAEALSIEANAKVAAKMAQESMKNSLLIKKKQSNEDE